jgi:large subunit ribosomal protein L9
MNVGKLGDILTVKDGYARNYLIPRSLAYTATEKSIKVLEIEKKKYDKQMAKEKVVAEELAEKLADLQISIAMKVGEEGRLYGSVSPQMISQELLLRGFDIDRRNVIIEDGIKSLGVFDIKVKLHPEVITPLKIWVINEE